MATYPHRLFSARYNFNTPSFKIGRSPDAYVNQWNPRSLKFTMGCFLIITHDLGKINLEDMAFDVGQKVILNIHVGIGEIVSEVQTVDLHVMVKCLA